MAERAYYNGKNWAQSLVRNGRMDELAEEVSSHEDGPSDDWERGARDVYFHYLRRNTGE